MENVMNSSSDTVSAREAADALAAVAQSKQRLAAAADCPPERHLAFAALMGLAISIPGVAKPWVFLLEIALFALIVAIVRWDRRRTGMFINGYRAGATRPLTFAMLGAFLALYMGGLALKEMWGLDWAPFALGVIGAVGGYAFSRHWQRVFRRELGVGA